MRGSVLVEGELELLVVVRLLLNFEVIGIFDGWRSKRKQPG